MITPTQCNLLNRIDDYFHSKTAPKTKKDQEKLIKALDIVAEMLEFKNCNECYPLSDKHNKQNQFLNN